MEQLKSSYSQSSQDQYETGLNAIRLQYEGELRKYDLESKRLKELN